MLSNTRLIWATESQHLIPGFNKIERFDNIVFNSYNGSENEINSLPSNKKYQTTKPNLIGETRVRVTMGVGYIDPWFESLKGGVDLL